MDGLQRMRLDAELGLSFRAAQLIVEGPDDQAVLNDVVTAVEDALTALSLPPASLNDKIRSTSSPRPQWRTAAGLPPLHLIHVPHDQWDGFANEAHSRIVMDEVQKAMLRLRGRYGKSRVYLNLVRFAAANDQEGERTVPQGLGASLADGLTVARRRLGDVLDDLWPFGTRRPCCSTHPSQQVHVEPTHLLLSRLRAEWVRPDTGGVYPDPAVDLDATQQRSGSLTLNPWRLHPWRLNPWRLNPWRLNPWRLNPWRLNPWRLNWGSTMAVPVNEPSPIDVNKLGDELREKPTVWILDSGLGDYDGDGHTQAEWVWSDAERTDESPVRDAPLTGGEDYQNPYLRDHAADVKGDHFDRPDRHPPADVPNQGDGPGDGLIDVAAGHGTFVAGIYERLVPGCKLRVRSVIGPGGDASTWTVISVLEQLAALKNPAGIDATDAPPADYLGDVIVNLSLGGTEDEFIENGVNSKPPLEQLIDHLVSHGAAVVASAGNEGSCEPNYPAAFDNVVAVGALDEFGPAPYSNYGDWIDVWAPGTDLVSTFLLCDGRLRSFLDGAESQAEIDVVQDVLGMSDEQVEEAMKDPDRFGTAWAAWSGSSFAAPVVGAAIAAAMISAPPSGPTNAAAAATAVVNTATSGPGVAKHGRPTVEYGSDVHLMPPPPTDEPDPEEVHEARLAALRDTAGDRFGDVNG